MAAGDHKIAYGSSSNLTITLQNLASDSSLLTGRESSLVDNTSDKYIDYLLSGFISVGTTPTANTYIEVWVHGTLDDSYTLVDGLAGTDGAKTLTNVMTKSSGLVLAKTITVTATTSNVKYPIFPLSVAALFGGKVPKKFGVFVTHSTAVNLRNTTDHQITVTPIYATIAQ